MGFGPFSDAVAHHPGNASSADEQWYPVPPAPGHVGIGKEVLELLLTGHAQGLETVSGLACAEHPYIANSIAAQESRVFDH